MKCNRLVRSKTGEDVSYSFVKDRNVLVDSFVGK